MTTKKTAANQAANPTAIVEETMAATEQSVGAAVKAAEEVATKGFEQALGVTRDYYEQASKALFQGYEDAAAYNKANVEAILKANQVMAKGIEDANRAVFTLAQASFEKSVATTKAVLGAKTRKEVLDLQAEHAKTLFDGVLAETSKIGEQQVKVANEAIAPINERVNAAVEKLGKAA